MEVAIQDLAFAPATLSAPVGATVRWVNRDTRRHTATSDTGVWDSKILEPGQSFSFTFSQAGTFPYHCDVHPQMKATITISPAAGALPDPAPAPHTGHSAARGQSHVAAGRQATPPWWAFWAGGDQGHAGH
jgi:hypothetical protein